MIHDVTDSTLPAIRAFLEAYVETSLFLLSNLKELGHRLTEHLNSGNYRHIEENGEIQAVFCLTRRGNILAQTGGHADYADPIFRSCESEAIPIQGVVAEWIVADAIWKLLCADRRFHPTYASKETLFSMKLSNDGFQSMDSKGARPLATGDFDDWLKLNDDYLIEEGLPVQGTVDQRKAQFQEQTQAGLWWGAFDKDKLSATAALNATYASLGQVGGVYTLPEKRRQGLARRAMQYLIVDSVRRHRLDKLILFTGERNNAARQLYAGLGFTNIGHFGLLFGSWRV